MLAALLCAGAAQADVLAGWAKTNAATAPRDYLAQINHSKLASPAIMEWKSRFICYSDNSWFYIEPWSSTNIATIIDGVTNNYPAEFNLLDGISATNQYSKRNGQTFGATFMPITNYIEFTFSVSNGYKISFTGMVQRVQNDEKRLNFDLRSDVDGYTYRMFEQTGYPLPGGVVSGVATNLQYTTNSFRTYTNVISSRLRNLTNSTVKLRMYGTEGRSHWVYAYWTNMSTNVSSVAYGNCMIAFEGTIGRSGNVTPGRGPYAGGNPVVMTNVAEAAIGDGGDITNILVDGVAAPLPLLGQGTNWVRWRMPAATSAGVKDIHVQSTSKGDSAFLGEYTYNPTGIIVRLSPTSGVSAGGYDVAIIGSNLCDGTDVTNVTFGGVAASLVGQTPTQVVATVPAGAGTVDVRVYSTSYGQSLGAGLFTYTNGGIQNPTITTQPISAVVGVGAAASLSVSNSGAAPFGYQWLKDGVILPGQTNSTLAYAAFQFTNSGSYNVVITNSQGMAISYPASLSVANAALLAWGNNSYGQLGNGTNGTGIYTNLPITVASNVVAVAAGGNHSLFMKADGALWAMGYNGTGQLGNGTWASADRPMHVTNDVVALAGGYNHSLFVKADGTLWAMGHNAFGPLGNGNNTDTNRPTYVTNNVVAVAAGGEHSMFVKADGSLWAMGYNGDGELGNGTLISINRAIQVTNGVVAVAAGYQHSMFVKADGTLWAMGDNVWGQLGNGTYIAANLPIQVTSNVVAVAGGNYHSLFVKTDGTLWAMGNNSVGELGIGTTTKTNRPTYVTNNVVAVAAGGEHSLFMKADGTLLAMGYNNFGQLGDGSLTRSSVPVLVNNGGLLTASLAKGDRAYHSLAIAAVLTPGMRILGTNGAAIASGDAASLAAGNKFPPTVPGAVVTNTFSITNNGLATLTISGWTTNGANPSTFSLQSSASSIPPGAVGSFTVSFTPVAVGDFTASLVISNNSPIPAYTVNLAGSCFQLTTNLGPYAGGNTITITNGNFGDITNVLVGGVQATLGAHGANWFTITLPATGSGGVKDIVIQTSDNGAIMLPGAYTVCIPASQLPLGAVAYDASTLWSGTPIRWRVVHTNYGGVSGSVTLSATNSVGGRAFLDGTWNNRWQDATLRTWLNSTNFYGTFSPTFSSIVLRTSVPWAIANPHGVPSSGITTDAVFIASCTELGGMSLAGDGSVLSWFSDSGTAARRGNVSVTPGWGYWTRTGGEGNYDGTGYDLCAYYVNAPAGSIGLGNWTSDILEVVPVMNINGAAQFAPQSDGSYRLAFPIVQSIAFPNPGAQLTTNKVSLVGTASSGLAVTFTNMSGPAVLENGTNLTFTGAGTVVIVASQTGSSFWDPAPDVTNTFMVSLTPQAALNFNLASPQTYATTNTIFAIGGSGSGVVSYAVASGPGTILGGAPLKAGVFTLGGGPTVRLTVTSGTGVVVVVATKASDSLYTAQSVTSMVACAKAAQVIAFNSIGNQFWTNIVALTATSSSGLTPLFEVTGGAASITNDTRLSFHGYGEVSVSASQGGDANYNSALAVTNTFDVLGPRLIVCGTNGAAIMHNATPAAAAGSDFGRALVGSTPITNTFSLENLGVVPLTFSGVTPSGSGASSFSIRSVPATVGADTGGVLFDNGPIVNSPGTGVGGADESVVQAPLSAYGFSCSSASGHHVADDFVVSGSAWNVSSLDFYGYQTGSSSNSTFTAIYIQIWNGRPGDAGSAVVWGDRTTNRLSGATFSGIYRVLSAGSAQTTRPVMTLRASTPGLALNPGTYWVEYSAAGSLGSGPWIPPVTISNQPTTGNAMQYVAGTWTNLAVSVGGTNYYQGIPFVVNSEAVTGTTCSVVFTPEAGRRDAAFTFAFDGTNSPYVLNVTGYGMAGGIALSSNSLIFGATFGGGSPASQTVSLGNVGRTDLSYTNVIKYGTGAAGWLSVHPVSGAMASGVATSLVFDVDSTAMNAGTYYATSVVYSAEATNSPQAIAVQLTIAKADQAITSFVPADGATFPFGASTSVTATATSGLPVSFSNLTTGIATLVGNNLTFTNPGLARVQATQSGDANWNTAAPVTHTWRVGGLITNVTPGAANVGGGINVLIQGLSLGNGSDITNVTLAGVEAGIVTQTVESVTVLAGAATGTITGDVTVESGTGGAMVLSNAFTYLWLDAPVQLDPVEITASNLLARWQTVSNATTHKLDVGLDTNFTAHLTGYDLLDVALAQQYPVTGLTNGGWYALRLFAWNTNGYSLPSRTVWVPATVNTPYEEHVPLPGLISTGAVTRYTLKNMFHGTGLDYTAESSDTNVVVVAIIGRQFELTPRNPGTATITVHAYDSSTGYTASYSFLVTVGGMPTLLGSAFMTREPWNPRFTQVLRVRNDSAMDAIGIRVLFTNLYAGITVENRTGTAWDGRPMIEMSTAFPVGSTQNLSIVYLCTGAYSVVQHPPTIELQYILPGWVAPIPGTGTSVLRIVPIPDGSGRIVLEFETVVGEMYAIGYMTNFPSGNWIDIPLRLPATANRTQWIDSGPPATVLQPPSGLRAYQVKQLRR